MLVSAPPPPRVRLSVGVTGHREGNAAFAAQRARIETVLAEILDAIAAAVVDAAPSASGVAPTRLHSLLADGADQIAANGALTRGWELVAPLPFGLPLNVAINSHPSTADEARALMADEGDFSACSPEVQERAGRIVALAAQARLFELADSDDTIAGLFMEKLQSPGDVRRDSTFAAESSLRAALAARVMIEQSDFLIAVWDGATRALVGGTGHTIQIALETGAPVLWIDAHRPESWRILSGPEALACLDTDGTVDTDRDSQLRTLVRNALRPVVAGESRKRAKRRRSPPGAETLELEAWPVHSSPLWHFYRRTEVLFGTDKFRSRFRNLRQTYETPDAILTGSAAPLLSEARALPGQDADSVAAVETGILRRFAWADGVASHLSDTYRGGMVANFLLAPLAIVGGIAYLPFATSQDKWLFALFELALLSGILAITLTGQKRRWHGRWFETRRVAEYLRHAPILLWLGVARAPGRWPLGTETSWPEWYARHALRDVGLPRLIVTQDYLRKAVGELLRDHVSRQRDYHIGKAKRLAAVHHNLDKLSEALFTLAVVAVAGYLVLKGGGLLHWWPKSVAENLSYVFTFLGVLLPTFGGAIAGIRYFGDFERFSAISRVTSEKLQVIHTRVAQLLAAPEGALDYGRVADLAHATDDVVVSEIESWQAVFGGKHVTVPV